VAFGMLVIGCCIENTKYGDDKQISNDYNEEALLEAAKFRRLEQYDHILLQRKTEVAQKTLAFSFLRNGVHLNIPQRAFRTSKINEDKNSRSLP
jgi:hypothetical protein